MLQTILLYILFGVNACIFSLMARGAWEEYNDELWGGHPLDLFGAVISVVLVLSNATAIMVI